MGYLVDFQLKQLCRKGLVSPYDEANVNPASVDLTLRNGIRRPSKQWKSYVKGINLVVPTTYAGRWKNGVEDIVFDDRGLPTVTWGIEEMVTSGGFRIEPGEFVLCATEEVVSIPEDCIAFLWLKSSLGRRGIEHLHAGLGDPGFVGSWTLEISNVAPWPQYLYPGQRIVQMTVEKLDQVPEKSYKLTGRYNGQVEAQPAK